MIRVLLFSPLGLQARLLGELLGWRYSAFVGGLAASPVIGAIAAGAGGIGSQLWGRIAAEKLANALTDLLDDTDSQDPEQSTDQSEQSKTEVSEGPLIRTRLAYYDYAGFNDELDFNDALDFSSLQNDRAIGETPRSSLRFLGAFGR